MLRTSEKAHSSVLAVGLACVLLGCGGSASVEVAHHQISVAARSADEAAAASSVGLSVEGAREQIGDALEASDIAWARATLPEMAELLPGPPLDQLGALLDEGETGTFWIRVGPDCVAIDMRWDGRHMLGAFVGREREIEGGVALYHYGLRVSSSIHITGPNMSTVIDGVRARGVAAGCFSIVGGLGVVTSEYIAPGGVWVRVSFGCDRTYETHDLCLDGDEQTCVRCTEAHLHIEPIGRVDMRYRRFESPRETRRFRAPEFYSGGEQVRVDCSAGCPEDELTRLVPLLNNILEGQRFYIVEDRDPRIYRSEEACVADVGSRPMSDSCP